MDTIQLIKTAGISVYELVGRALELFDRLGGKLERLESLPVIGGSVADLCDTLSMLNDYYHGRYSKLPFAAALGALVIAAYLISPIDLIPDGIPLLGFIDDAFIVNAIIGACLDAELTRYRRWRGDEV